MKDNWRIPVAEPYALALGRATYCFAYAEWGIIWLGETVDQGLISWASGQTSGNVGERFARIASQLPEDMPDRLALVGLSKEFLRLVNFRNGLAHGRPFSADDGEQRLSYNGKSGEFDWSIDKIDEFTRACEDLALETDKFVHTGRLAQLTLA